MAAVLITVVAPGCGSDDDEGDGARTIPGFSQPEGPVSEERARYIERADRVCTISMAAGRQLPARPRTPGQVVVLGRGLVELYDTAIKSIQALPLPPSGADRAGAKAFRDAAEAILPAVRRVDRLTVRLQRAIRERDAGEARRIIQAFGPAQERLSDLDLASTRIADRYGMDECGDDGSDPEPPDIPLGPEV